MTLLLLLLYYGLPEYELHENTKQRDLNLCRRERCEDSPAAKVPERKDSTDHSIIIWFHFPITLVRQATMTMDDIIQ